VSRDEDYMSCHKMEHESLRSQLNGSHSAYVPVRMYDVEMFPI
jgi:hypothetical protein